MIGLERNWVGKNMDLALLTTRIGDFFKLNDFEAVKGEIPSGYQIIAGDSPHFKINGCVSVSIEGTSDNFTVNFELATDKKKTGHPHSMVLEQMMFGGYFILRKLKSEEAWLKLEKEFWRYLENTVLWLGDSAKASVNSHEQGS
jgi:hypothetical protein